MADRKCEAQQGPDDYCTERAAVIIEDGHAYCDTHYRWLVEQGYDGTTRPAWVDEAYEIPPPDAPPAPKIELRCSDLVTAILQKVSTTGLPEGLLVKVAWGSIQGFIAAHDRWQRLEVPSDDRRIALWLSETEANKLLSMLAGQKGSTGRLIRQEIQDLFNS